MGARSKLNTLFFQGALVVAGTAGLATGSWNVFFGTLVVLTAVLIITGDVRPKVF